MVGRSRNRQNSLRHFDLNDNFCKPRQTDANVQKYPNSTETRRDSTQCSNSCSLFSMQAKAGLDGLFSVKIVTGIAITTLGEGSKK